MYKEIFDQLMLKTSIYLEEQKPHIIRGAKFCAIMAYAYAACCVAHAFGQWRDKRKGIASRRRYRILRRFNTLLHTYGVASEEARRFYKYFASQDKKLVKLFTRAALDELDGAVSAWHHGESYHIYISQDESISLEEFLFLDGNQYAMFVENPTNFIRKLYE